MSDMQARVVIVMLGALIVLEGYSLFRVADRLEDFKRRFAAIEELLSKIANKS